jgi:HK97 family phage portal protein
MRSGLRKLLNQGSDGPPVPYTNTIGNNGHYFNLGVGTASFETYLRMFSSNGTIFAIVSLLANTVSSSNWRMYQKTMDGRVRYTTADRGSDQRKEVVKHPALDLWHSPNPFQTTSEFVEGFSQHLELTGEAYWLLNLSAYGFPTSMWYVRPDRMEPVPSETEFLAGWVYTAPDGTKIPLSTKEVIQIKYPSPLDPYRGQGPIQTVLADIQGANYASDYNRNFFLNSARPDGLIQVPNRLSETEYEELQNRWRESHQGISRVHRVGVLEQGSSWITTSTSPKDMDFSNLIETNRDKLREAFALHKAMLGNSDDVNRANAQTAEEVYGTWKVVPRLKKVKTALNERLLPLFGGNYKSVEFDYDDPLPANREADALELHNKAQAVQFLVAAGYDPTDVLEAVGLPDMAIAEKATQQPALPPGWVAAPNAAPDTSEPDADDNQLANGSLSNLMLAGISKMELPWHI